LRIQQTISELLSIITPVFNNVKDIETCLKSVADQTYIHKEHWIIDGGSTDGTLGVIKEYANKYKHIKWISEKDNGIYEAMNKGIDKANGNWLYFLGSDDKLINNTIIEEVLTNPEFLEYDILYGNVLAKEIGEIWGYETNINGLKLRCTNHQATFTRKHIFNNLGKYNTEYKTCADWAFTIKCFKDTSVKLKYIDKIIAVYSIMGFSNTANNHNPRLRDKKFRSDFFSLFEHVSCLMRVRIYMEDYIPKYLNPIKYFFYFKDLARKVTSNENT